MGEILLSEEDRKKVEASFDERRAAFEREAREAEEAFEREVLGKKCADEKKAARAAVGSRD